MRLLAALMANISTSCSAAFFRRALRAALIPALAGAVALVAAPPPRFFPDDPIWVDDDKALDASKTGPVEDSAEGTISFLEFVPVYGGREVPGVRLRFESGRVVDASAEREEDYLLETLDANDGARRIGELGVGCNPGITRYFKNTLFDEKIDGTVHIALGNGFAELGGTNVSTIHWDIVKDLRVGGQLLLDGEVVQENGAWVGRLA